MTPNKSSVVLRFNYSKRSGAKSKLDAGTISVTNLERKKGEKNDHILRNVGLES